MLVSFLWDASRPGHWCVQNTPLRAAPPGPSLGVGSAPSALFCPTASEPGLDTLSLSESSLARGHSPMHEGSRIVCWGRAGSGACCPAGFFRAGLWRELSVPSCRELLRTPLEAASSSQGGAGVACTTHQLPSGAWTGHRGPGPGHSLGQWPNPSPDIGKYPRGHHPHEDGCSGPSRELLLSSQALLPSRHRAGI